jgi:hypothetical protein
MTRKLWMRRFGNFALAGALAFSTAGCASSLGSNSGSGSATSGDAGPLARLLQKQTPITLAAGTSIPVSLDQAISSGQQRSGDEFEASVSAPVVINGKTVIPKGARAKGRVIDAQASGHLKTVAHLELALESVEVEGKSYPVETGSLNFSGSNHNKRNLAMIGGGKGALIGGLVGAGAGTAGAAATGKKDITLAPETSLTFRLMQAITVASKG